MLKGPLGLRERIGLIVFFQAVTMFVIVAAFIASAEQWKGAPVYRLPTPEAVAAIAAAFEQTPPLAHEDLVRAFTGTTQVVVLLPRLPDAAHSIATEQTAGRYRDALQGRPFRILASSRRAPSDYGDLPLFSTGRLQVAAALADGRSVAVSQMATAPVAQILNKALLFFGLIIGVNFVFALLIAAQTRRPVDRLLRAVQQDNYESFVISGPREIVALGAAFHDLRLRLQAAMDERTRMVGAIAHDFRTYLTRMELRSDFIADDRQRGLASRDIGEMNALIDDTLLYAQDVTAGGEDIASTELSAALAVLVEERLTSGQSIHLRRPDGEAEAFVSPVSFRRIMTNLLDNVLRYGGGEAMVTLYRAEGAVIVQVDDKGPGVPEAALARLTEPFHRLETSRSRETGGVGLGLSIVQALASRHGGRLDLSNRPGGGLRVHLLLRDATTGDLLTSRNNPGERR